MTYSATAAQDATQAASPELGGEQDAAPSVSPAEEALADPSGLMEVVSGAAANPLRDPRDRRIPRVAGPCVLVIFGVTGDLARKKLMPAIYDLANRGLLPPGFSLVGFARRDWEDEDFAQVTYEAVKEHARTPFRDTVWRQVSEGVRFVPGEFTDAEAFDRLAHCVAELDRDRGTGGNYAFYLSVPPKFFELVVTQLKRSGLSTPPPPAPGHQRTKRQVVKEKTLANDLESAL